MPHPPKSRPTPSYPKLALYLLLLLTTLAWLTCLPTPLFNSPYSTVVEARDGRLLSARIAADEQWRFPPSDSLDGRYARCVTLFEDAYFRWHPGVNPVSIGRALRQNLWAGRTVSGGSTLTMQTVRLMRGRARRSVWEKLVEVAWATRLELTYSKDDILALYAAHAPFGGNVVGLDAAAWRYYGRGPTHFSWGEAAALAVLPNAPGVIYPGRSDAAFRQKRDRLLDKLHARGDIDAETLALAKLEPLPGEPLPLPDLAPQLALPDAPLARTAARQRTTLDPALQRRVTEIIEVHRRRNAGNGVHNACAIVSEVRTGNVLAYVGNAAGAGAQHGDRVDILQARRSSGSLLKPFLFAGLLDAGTVSPTTLLPDVPTLIGGYAPQNFDLGFDGAVPAGQALTRSLNVPHVKLLQGFGVQALLDRLRATGLHTLDRSADDYGLSLILGGAEVTAWDISGAYRGLAHTVLTYHEHNRQYTRDSYGGLRLCDGAAHRASAGSLTAQAPLYSAAAAYLTLNTLTQLERPGDLAAWRSFGGSRKVAWKTGTSFGFRDAWAVGVTPEYVVTVWVGNADGEGRPDLTGSGVAAPLLFDVYDALPETTWFDAPVADMRAVAVCRASGLHAGAACPHNDTTLLPAIARGLPTCAYHERVFVDGDGLRVDNTCAQLTSATEEVAFVLPPSWALYFRRHHPEYVGMPAWSAACVPAGDAPMAMVYPRGGRTLHLPRNLAGERQAAIFEVAHQEATARLDWYLDGRHVGTTERQHQRALEPPPGQHTLVVIDERGRELRYGFAVI